MRVLILFALQTWSAPIVIVEKDIEDQSMRIGDSILMYVLSVQGKNIKTVHGKEIINCERCGVLELRKDVGIN